jgi:anthranilate synthase/aminodeoxychorismate synthase-like glutamine amidotransferase
MILLVDNYDSFVYNLARYFERLGQATLVVRNDAIDAQRVRTMAPDALILSPGPCAPEQAGASLELVRELYREVPILGVCLGHQTIAAALGGRVIRANEPVHGRASEIVHSGSGIFARMPNPIRACRYHSLVVEEASLPNELEVTARTADSVVMAIAHRELPIIGVQFHPESILTDYGYELLAGFLGLAGLPLSDGHPTIAHERIQPTSRPLPTAPVTF